MRRQDHVGQSAQRGLEGVPLGLGLDREHVESSPRDVAGEDVLPQCDVVDDHAARGVDEHRARPHLRELLGAEEARVAGPAVDVERDHVGLLEQLVERPDASGIAVREAVGGVEEDHPEAKGLGQVGELSPDVAVAHDAERPSPDLVAALRGLVPDPVVHPLGLLRQPAGQGDDLADDELDDAPGVGVRRVEGGDPAPGSGIEVDLVGADAEGPDGGQVGVVQDPVRDLGVGADADHGHALEGLDQVVLTQGAGARVDDEPVALEHVGRGGMDVLEQENFVFRHRASLRGRPVHRSPASTMR